MSLADLIRKRETGRANAKPAKAANDGQVKGEPLARLATLAVAKSQDDETNPLSPAAEARRQGALAILADHPGIRYALITDTDVDSRVVIVAVGIRNKGTCELQIPRAKYDGVRLLELIEKREAWIEDSL